MLRGILGILIIAALWGWLFYRWAVKKDTTGIKNDLGITVLFTGAWAGIYWLFLY